MNETIEQTLLAIKESIVFLLEQEKVGWRLTNGLMTRFVEKAEIDIIEDALKTVHNSVTEHIQSALHSFADRNNPDYRNSCGHQEPESRL